MISPFNSSRNSAVSISPIRCFKSFPFVELPDKPRVLRMEISPPLKLISRCITNSSQRIALCRVRVVATALCRRESARTPRPAFKDFDAADRARRLQPQPRVRIFLQPIPKLLQTFADFCFDRFQLGGRELSVGGPLLSKQVIFNFWFR